MFKLYIEPLGSVKIKLNPSNYDNWAPAESKRYILTYPWLIDNSLMMKPWAIGQPCIVHSAYVCG